MSGSHYHSREWRPDDLRAEDQMQEAREVADDLRQERHAMESTMPEALEALALAYRAMIHRTASTHHAPVAFHVWLAPILDRAYHESLDHDSFVAHLLKEART